MKISLAIPCAHNHIERLDELVCHILRGTTLPDEIVIVVSGIAEDEKYDEMLYGLERKFRGVRSLRIVSYAHKLNIPTARHILSNQVTGDLIMYHDADDLQSLTRVKIVKWFFERYDIVHLCHSYRFFNEEWLPTQNPWHIKIFSSDVLYEKYVTEKEVPKSFGSPFMKTCAGALCIRREVLEKVSWEGLRLRGQDTDFCLNVLKEFNKTILIDAVLYSYFVS